jgi:hypothetical protein
MALRRCVVEVVLLLAALVSGGGQPPGWDHVAVAFRAAGGSCHARPSLLLRSTMRLRGGFMAKWGTQHMKGMTSKRPKVSATQARQRRNEAFEELVAVRRRDQSEAQVQRLRQEELLRQAAGTQSDEGAVTARNQTASVPRAEDTEASCVEEASGGGRGEHAAEPRGAVRAKRQRETPADTAEDGAGLTGREHGREYEDQGDDRPAKQRRTAPPGAGAGAWSHASPSAQEAPPGELPALERAAEEGLARGEPDTAVRVISFPPTPLPCVPLDPHG